MREWFNGIRLPEIMVVVLAVLMTVFGVVIWEKVDGQNDRIVVMSYTRLTNLYTGEAAHGSYAGSGMDAQTALFLSKATEAAEDFARRTGTIVIMREAVVASDEELSDITDLVFGVAMNRIREEGQAQREMQPILPMQMGEE